ncbi:TIGR02444 family protein [Aliidiomarina sp. Khilg15.8]
MAGTDRNTGKYSELTAETFWDAAIAIYQEPGMQAQLLRAQDEARENVNLQLLAIYLQRQGHPLSDQQYRALNSQVQAFSQQLTQPLRAQRRQLTVHPALNEKSRQQLKKQLLAAELTLEAEEQRLLVDAYHSC